MDQSFWRKCSVCKKELSFGANYFVCSVSSCNKKSAPTQFCTVECWDNHRAVLNHMSAGADHMRAPSYQKWKELQDRPTKRIVVSKSSSPVSHMSKQDTPKDVLVVVSKLKAYISNVSGLNTSSDVNAALSDIIRIECDKAIERAKLDGRKTVMARDF